MRFLLEADVDGQVNVSAPAPVTNREYTRAIATAVHRPALFAAPAPALKAALGGCADSVLTGQRVLPKVLAEAGFEVGYPEIGPALRALVEANA
jgi:NAD dependent epimerase/dehydratase family enzyme